MASAEHQNLATAKTILSAVGSVAATFMMVRGVSQDLLPAEFQDYIFSGIRNFFTRFSNQFTLVIDQFDGLVNNEIYEAAVTYLGPKVSPRTRRLKISKLEKEKHFNVTMEEGEEVVDMYNGEIFRWVMTCRKGETNNFHDPRGMGSYSRSEIRSFALTFHKKNRELAINSYLPYITKEAQIEKQKKRTIKIFTLDNDGFGHSLGNMWNPVTLDHPTTFETLAMDSEQKDMILNDLDQFIGRKEYYRKVGKAWKRGYLLYGPPGTGKSSLVAAIANYLNFDIYDLELTALRHNTDLRRLLVATANKSILVVEDIDCTIDLQEKLAKRGTTSGYYEHQDITKITLSGLLNFVDGLWSSCGDERIIIFTTNHIDKLDPALLRPGRMDVHINLSYCTPCGFQLLASNYLGIVDHVLFEEIEGLIQIAKVTPAEVAEQLLKNGNPDVSLTGLIGFMHKKIKEDDEAEKLKAEAAEKLKAEAAEKLKAEATETLKAEAGEKLEGESVEKLVFSSPTSL